MWLSMVRSEIWMLAAWLASTSWARLSTCAGLASRLLTIANSIAVRLTSRFAETSPCGSPDRATAGHAPAAAGQVLARRLRARAPQDDVDAGDQLARAERLGHIVVAAHLEAEDAVDLLVARRQEQDRHIRCPPDQPADLQPVHLRHADVEHDKAGRPLLEGAQRGRAVGDRLRDHAGLLQRKGDDLADMRVVVGDKDVVRHAFAVRQGE